MSQGSRLLLGRNHLRPPHTLSHTNNNVVPCSAYFFGHIQTTSIALQYRQSHGRDSQCVRRYVVAGGGDDLGMD